MAQIDLEPIGRLERTIQPALNRFSLNAEMGVNTVLSPDAARATVQAFTVLSRTIDLMEAEKEAMRQLVKMLGALLLFASVIALFAWGA